jgi:hypothetical protein
MKQGHHGVPWVMGKGRLIYENLVIDKEFVLDR